MSRFAPRPQSTSFLDRIFGSSSDHGEHQLQVWLEGTLKRDLKLDSIERDEDGDIVIAAGSAVVFIRTSDGETPCIVIFSPLLAEFAMRPEVYEAVNTINRNTPFAKAIVDPDGPQIVLSAELPIFDGLSPEQLVATIELVADRADHYDTRLQKRFGGQTMLDDEEGDEFDV
ncbi:YbjN domain-containing protein [Mycolicibacterium sp. S3B2]|uniref:YbjN domain-containing protein n=1 Tax=Mycolicibacterium sp. S3B2 TaxID=3415120 RepID=UPI003C7B31C4